MIFVGGIRTSSKSVWGFHTYGGSLAWSYDTGGDIKDLHLDRTNEQLYAVGEKSTYNLWKLNSISGGFLNQYYADNGNTEFDPLNTVALDSSGNIFVGGKATWNHNLCGKVPTTMDSITNFRPGDGGIGVTRHAYTVVIDSDGDIWVGSNRSSSQDICKYDAADLTAVLWGRANTGDCYAATISSTGKVIFGYTTGGLYCYDISAPGDAEWSNTSDYTSRVNAITFDSNNNMYVAWGTNLSKVSLVDGSQIWNIAHGTNLYDIAIDVSDNIFVCGARAGSYTIWQVDTVTPALTGIIDSGGDCYTIACSALGYNSFLKPRDVRTIKILVAAANNKVYYEDE